MSTTRIVYGNPTRYFLDGVEVGEREYRIRSASPRLEEMLACQQPPMVRSDSTFLRGHANGRQFETTPHLGDAYAAEARAAGVNVNGKVYLSSLAAFPGDPRAWVSDRGDVQRVCEERGWSCEGAVTVKPRSSLNGPPQGPAVADDLVDRAVAEAVARDPGLAEKDPGEVRHDATQAIAPAWAKGGGG